MIADLLPRSERRPQALGTSLSLGALEWRNQRVVASVVLAEGASMSDLQSPAGRRQLRPLAAIPFGIVSWLDILFFVASPRGFAQSAAPSPAAPTLCPVQFLHFDPDGVTARIKNVTDKKIVGLVFNAAVADATEHWKWLHWNFDDARPIQNFGWNKPIKAGETKKLSWERVDLDFEHGGGGAFVLTSVLFEDGSSWEEADDRASCKYVWFHNYKSSLLNQSNCLSHES
jgi:hypothetical protein